MLYVVVEGRTELCTLLLDGKQAAVMPQRAELIVDPSRNLGPFPPAGTFLCWNSPNPRTRAHHVNEWMNALFTRLSREHYLITLDKLIIYSQWKQRN